MEFSFVKWEQNWNTKYKNSAFLLFFYLFIFLALTSHTPDLALNTRETHFPFNAQKSICKMYLFARQTQFSRSRFIVVKKKKKQPKGNTRNRYTLSLTLNMNTFHQSIFVESTIYWTAKIKPKKIEKMQNIHLFYRVSIPAIQIISIAFVTCCAKTENFFF